MNSLFPSMAVCPLGQQDGTTGHQQCQGGMQLCHRETQAVPRIVTWLAQLRAWLISASMEAFPTPVDFLFSSSICWASAHDTAASAVQQFGVIS